MTVEEHKFIGNVFLITVAALIGTVFVFRLMTQKARPAEGEEGSEERRSPFQEFDLLICGGFLMFFAAAWKLLGKAIPAEDLAPPTASGVLMSVSPLVAMAVAIPFILSKRVDLSEHFGLLKPIWKKVFWIAPCFVLGFTILAAALQAMGWRSWVEEVFGGGSQETVELFLTSNDPWLLGSLVFAAVVIAPFAEEIIFRGYLYPVIKGYSHAWIATLGTGVLFGVVHFNLMGLPVLSLIGIALALLFQKTGSLWICIGCHAAFNGTTVTVLLLCRWLEIPVP